MERRDVGYAVAYLLSFIFIAIIGISFAVFVDQKQRVEVCAITIRNEQGFDVESGKQKGGKLSLKVYSPKVGTKPVSGELDTQTDIPYTVSDQVGSEGAYAKFGIVTDKQYRIVLTDVDGVPERDLDNVKFSFTKNEKKAFSANDIGETVFSKNGNGKKETLTILVWLDRHVSKKIVGSKISFVFSIFENN